MSSFITPPITKFSMKKIYSLVFLFCTATLLSQAQSSFVKQLPLTGGQSIVATQDGGYLVTGIFLIAKYNASDKIVWTIKAKDTTIMQFVKAIPTRDNGFVVLANTINQGNITPEVSKFDASGNPVWKQAIYGNQAIDIVEDQTGNYIISYINSADVISSRFIKMDVNGSFVWTKSLSDPSYDNFISSIKVTHDNKYAAAGSDFGNSTLSLFDTSGNQLMNKSFTAVPNFPTVADEFSNGDLLLITNGNNYGGVPYVTRFARSGAVVWQKQIGAAKMFENYHTAVISDSVILLAGYRTNTSFSDTMLMIAAMKTNGTFLWEKTIGTPNPAAAMASIKLKDGSYRILAGRAFYTFSRSRNNESYLIKLTAAGNTCNTTDVAVRAQTIALDTVNVPNYSSYTLNTMFPVLRISPAAKLTEAIVCDPAADLITDASLKTISAISGITAFSVKAYPNPVISNLSVTITLTKPDAVKAELVDLFGKTVQINTYTLPAGSSTKRLTIPSLPAGMYILKVSNSKEMITTKITKQ